MKKRVLITVVSSLLIYLLVSWFFPYHSLTIFNSAKDEATNHMNAEFEQTKGEIKDVIDQNQDDSPYTNFLYTLETLEEGWDTLNNSVQMNSIIHMQTQLQEEFDHLMTIDRHYGLSEDDKTELHVLIDSIRLTEKQLIEVTNNPNMNRSEIEHHISQLTSSYLSLLERLHTLVTRL
ncbi:hypothetical protein [Alkalibacillus haloalkaliphilus]|uniref:Uncharacterized protein n=1 Tax=Alkalibacillus haloalkaliphilus TaxID=94136 RepID=A0A511W137_9BACI|nr:hypothetical protein [Alkalibacillus haloalkaliphilus]GEN44451.1 hypothetical protein AHA02nite_02270 [Alkalibacillus haloalkaliphilus]